MEGEPTSSCSTSPRRKQSTKDRTVAEIERLAKKRENRRKSAHEWKKKRDNEIKRNEKMGRPGDVDFQRMIKRFRKYEMCEPRAHSTTGPLKINVVVRKRPVSQIEISRKDFDCLSCSNPRVYVHHCKLKVDGITKYLDNMNFELDHAFHESSSNEEVYENTAKYLVEFAVTGGRATCFAYGQTGSGKTYTMAGVQRLAAKDVFQLVYSPEYRDKQLEVHCAFFELYGGRCIDLLQDRKTCSIREDGKGRVQVEGLTEVIVSDEEELLGLIERGNAGRTTHATEMNSDSSRSHAICQIAFRPMSSKEGSEPFGKLSLIDLAGSERGQDTKHHNRQRRQESAEINKSLLALKECVRALDSGSSHVPYRGSKLTMILKDSFSQDARTVMISCISPVMSSTDHTLNTLRYADRVKEKAVKPDNRRQAFVTAGTPNRADRSQSPNLATIDSDYDSDDSASNEVAETSDDDGGIEEEEEAILEERLPPPPVKPTNNNSKLENGDKGRNINNRGGQAPKATSSKSAVPIVSSSPKSAKKPLPQKKPQVSHLSKFGFQGNNKASGVGDVDSDKKSANSRRQWAEPVTNQPKKLREPLQTKNPAAANVPSKARKDEEPTSGKSANFEDMVSKLVDMEEDILSTHLKAMQKNADLLTEEGELLSKVQGSDVVDYDIEEYATRLEEIISTKMEIFSDLKRKLSNFRKHLALEEVAHRIAES